VAAVVEPATFGNSKHVIEQVCDAALASRQLKFSHSRVVHENTTTRQWSSPGIVGA
jgi:hypothetical protein